MADRADGEDMPGVPKEVFELDKDERWHARLEEARARREVALREKAAGKPVAPRPKPWEIEGADVEKPPEINPVIQERGDDEKFDFADRLETITDAKDDAPPEPPVSAPPEPPIAEKKPERPRAAPEYNPARRQKLPTPQSRAAEPRARPQPSLVLPGAPDVADLAARYAATLDTVDETQLDRAAVEPAASEPETEPQPEATLVALPTAAAAPEDETVAAPMSRAERRRGIRPLGMAFALVGLAALPFTAEAPPLEFGPTMPKIDGFRMQPALGITWSLNKRPVATQSGEWIAPAVPAPFSDLVFEANISVSDDVVSPALPTSVDGNGLSWTSLGPVDIGGRTDIFVPDVRVRGAPFSPRSIWLLPPRPATRDDAVAPPSDAAISAPPRPPSLREESTGTPTPPEAPERPESSAVQSDPLRVTILSPVRGDLKVADEIGLRIQRDGHEFAGVKPVDFNISERNVRYFHSEDRAAAERMAARYGAELRDFTWFRPKPVKGTAEMWLAGRAPAGTGGPRDQGSTARGQGEATAESGNFLGRVFDRLGLGTELPSSLPNILPGANQGVGSGN